MSSLFFLKVSFSFYWGYLLSEYGLTKSRTAVETIPPTTLIGALTYPLLEDRVEETIREKDIVSSSETIREALVSVNLRFSGPLIGYSDLSRIVSFDVRKKKILTDAVAVEKVYSPGGSGDIIYVFDAGRIKELLGSDWKAKLVSSAWGIVRVGSKESLVSIEKVSLGGAERGRGVGETSYYFPEDMCEEVDGVFKRLRVVDWRRHPIGDYVGAPMVSLLFPYDDLRQRSTVVRVKGELVKVGEEVVVPWR